MNHQFSNHQDFSFPRSQANYRNPPDCPTRHPPPSNISPSPRTQKRVADRPAPRRTDVSNDMPDTSRETIETDAFQSTSKNELGTPTRKRKVDSKQDLGKRAKLSQENSEIIEISSTSPLTETPISSESPKSLPERPKRARDLFQGLTQDILHFDKDNSPSHLDIATKLAYCNFLSEQVSHSIHSARFIVFGSSLNGFSTQSSDLDITLLINEREYYARNPLRSIHRSLSRLPDRIYNCQLIAAKVPIVMFEDLKYGFEVDISINNNSGIRNTFLLRTYSRLDTRVRPLVIVAKEWAKSNNVCNSKSGLLSSYAINLMVLFFLQHAVTPQVLPSLQRLFPDIFNPYLTIDEIQEVNVKDICSRWSSENVQSVGELIVKFYEFYANVDFRDKLISVRTGCLLELYNHDYGTGYKGYINIEEPYTRDNAARSVYLLFRCKNIINEFKRKHKQLSNKGSPKDINMIFSQT